MIPSAVLEGVRRDLELWLSERVDPEQRQFIKTVVKTLCRDFILAWAVRGGVGFLPQLLKAFRSRQYYHKIFALNVFVIGIDLMWFKR